MESYIRSFVRLSLARTTLALLRADGHAAAKKWGDSTPLRPDRKVDPSAGNMKSAPQDVARHQQRNSVKKWGQIHREFNSGRIQPIQ